MTDAAERSPAGRQAPGRVAVVLRTQDRPLLLARALRSVHAQTHHDLVVWIVNDGGDRDLVEQVVAVSPAAKDERFTVVHHAQPRGRSEALNVGLEQGRAAPYLAIHDDDDTWDPRFLEVTAGYLASHAAAGAVGTRCEVVNEVIAGDSVVEVARETLGAAITDATLLEMAWSNFMPPISMLIRREAYDASGGFDPALPVLEDWDFTLRLMARYPMGFLADRPLAFWHHRQHSEGSDGNSVFEEADDHRHYDVVIRDSYLRGERTTPHVDLGPHLANAYYLRRISDKADLARAQMSETVDQWGRGHNDHLAVVATELNLVIGRLRGEVIALRDRSEQLERTVAVLAEAQPAALALSLRPVRRKLNRLSRQVDDLWGTSRPVSRLRRHRRADRQAAKAAERGE